MKSYHFHRFVIFVLISLTELLDNLYNECVFSLEDEVLNPWVELDVEGIKGQPMMMYAITKRNSNWRSLCFCWYPS